MKYILLLGADQMYRERAIVAAHRCHQGPVVTVSNKAPEKIHKMFDYVLKGNPLDPHSTVEAVNRFQSTTGHFIEAVIPLNDWVLQSSATVADWFGLRRLPSETIITCRNKLFMKNKLQLADVPTAKGELFRTVNELKEVVANYTFPLIIKPIDFGGSGGVVKVASFDELEGAFAHSKQIIDEYAGSFHDVSMSDFIVEECIDSDLEVSVEVLNTEHERTVLAVTQKYLGPEPYFAEIAHLVPSPLSDDEKIRVTALRACKALDIRFGLAHVEIKIKEGKPYVIEVGARPGGGGILDLVEKVYQFNPYELHIKSYLDGNFVFSSSITPQGTAALAGLYSPAHGKIAKIHHEIAIPDSVSYLHIYAEEQKNVEKPTCWKSRLGYIEMYWPSQIFHDITYKHIEMAEQITSQAFVFDFALQGATDA